MSRRGWEVGAGLMVGIGVALLAAWLAGLEGRPQQYTIMIVLAVAIVGLVLGALAAGSTLVGGVVSLATLIWLEPAGAVLTFADFVRLVALVVGSPIIVYLVRRGELAREAADHALEASQSAEARAAAERSAVESTREELNRTLVQAERDRARLEEVAEAIPEPLIVYDEHARGTYGNRAAMRLFGRSFVERPLDEWGHTTEPRDEAGQPLERREWPQLVAQSVATRRRVVLRIPMSGRDVIVDVEGTPIPGGGAVLLLRDVGKEEDARRRLSRFASFVAHELRNPMAVARARIELALREPDVPTRSATHGGRALESVEAAIGILERLELYSRADSGTLEATLEEFDLAPALGSAIERLRTGGAERQVLVSMASGIRVFGDRQLSEQAITNLLTNANRYSTSGAPVHVEVEADAAGVTLRVRDEGPGIGADVAERLFVERVAAGRGLGLGLFLVNASMQAMGGSVSLEQRRPAAVFALRWPVSRA